MSLRSSDAHEFLESVRSRPLTMLIGGVGRGKTSLISSILPEMASNRNVFVFGVDEKDGVPSDISNVVLRMDHLLDDYSWDDVRDCMEKAPDGSVVVINALPTFKHGNFGMNEIRDRITFGNILVEVESMSVHLVVLMQLHQLLDWHEEWAALLLLRNAEIFILQEGDLIHSRKRSILNLTDEECHMIEQIPRLSKAPLKYVKE